MCVEIHHDRQPYYPILVVAYNTRLFIRLQSTEDKCTPRRPSGITFTRLCGLSLPPPAQHYPHRYHQIELPFTMFSDSQDPHKAPQQLLAQELPALEDCQRDRVCQLMVITELEPRPAYNLLRRA
jgi:hypothetical protein